MPSWKGNNSNPAPNTEVVSAQVGSEKPVDDIRAERIRRDEDTQKNLTIGLYDIDETILTYLEKMQLQVMDDGQVVKVPYFFGAPDKWVSAKRDGYIRDKQGMIILPAIILKRTSSEADKSLQFFNRYLNEPVLQKYSKKNKYTPFSQLAGIVGPQQEVFNIVMASHMVLTYQFIIWTESVAQMNSLIEIFQFNTRDYWGHPKKGFRFRTQIESFGHTTEISLDEDRMVKTEFTMTTHGYILPETMTKLTGPEATTKRMLTKKKVVLSNEVVHTGFDMNQFDSNREKWRSPYYPNLPIDDPLATPGIQVVEGSEATEATGVASALKVTIANVIEASSTSGGVPDGKPYLKVVQPPASITDDGQEGAVAFDDDYFYIYSNGGWRRVPIAQFS
jgi:hypothetical protein